jgi:hypothetical protein
MMLFLAAAAINYPGAPAPEPEPPRRLDTAVSDRKSPTVDIWRAPTVAARSLPYQHYCLSDPDQCADAVGKCSKW